MTALLAASAAALAAILYLLATARAQKRELQSRLEARDLELLRAGEELARARDEHAQALRLEREELGRVRERLTAAEAAKARLEAELHASEHNRKLLDENLRETFTALSKQALDSNSAHLAQLAEQMLARAQEYSKADLEKRAQAVAEMVRPVHDQLHRVDEKIQQLETSTVLASRAITASGENLRNETARLVTALRAPAQRGRWGEMQLRRTLELAGLRSQVDFDEQPVAQLPDGALRPDVAVKLPGGKTVLLDSKVPMEAYLRAIEAPETEREPHLRAHAAQLRAHIDSLAGKHYWHAFAGSPEMAVLFLPSDGLLAAALEADPSLNDHALSKRIALATPSTLLSLLLLVAHFWKQESVAQNAREIANEGRELHKRVAKLAEHLAKLGRALGSALSAYNEVISSFETRLLPGAKRFEELKAAASDVEIAPLSSIEGPPRLPLTGLA